MILKALSRLSRRWRQQDEPLVHKGCQSPRCPCDMQPGSCRAKEQRIESKPKFAISNGDSMFIRSDIDSSGMSVMLTGFQHADTWDNEDDAAAFLRRVRERYGQQPLEVVPV